MHELHKFIVSGTQTVIKSNISHVPHINDTLYKSFSEPSFIDKTLLSLPKATK